MLRSAVVATLLLLPCTAMAWGSDGHRIVATIAAQRLTSAARAEVHELLAGNPDGKSLPAVSLWADWVRYEKMPETGNWHFVDIPLSRDTYDPGRDCRPEPGKGDCVIAALQRMRDVLADRQRPHRDRVEALMFVVHLAADLHQPLHVAERDGDKGGNKVEVWWMGERERRERGRLEGWNLHAVWDDGLLRESQRSTAQTVVQLNAWLATQNVSALQRGSVVDWALEAHTLARQQAYRDADGKSISTGGARLGRAYYKARIAAVDQQLAKAGVRLARLLNEALGDGAGGRDQGPGVRGQGRVGRTADSGRRTVVREEGDGIFFHGWKCDADDLQCAAAGESPHASRLGQVWMQR